MSSSRKAAQRDRLIAAMTQVCARHGYRDATIANAITLAGVSRATFYEHFEDKHGCFSAAQAVNTEKLIAHIERALTADNVREPMLTALSALLDFASANPDAMQLLVNESLAAGATNGGRHDELLTTLASAISNADPQVLYAVPPEILLAGVCRAIWPHLHAGETAVSRFFEDFAAWVSSYRLTDTDSGFACGELDRVVSSPFLPDPPLRAPKPLAPGRRVLPSGEVNRNRRERILYATAEAAAVNGYLAITVDEVVSRAQIARRAFYEHFEDTDDAFVGVLEFFAQPLLATAASAFFAQDTWPERVWGATSALLQFLDAYPSVAHAMLIDSRAATMPAVRSIQATERALMLLLEEGYRQTPESPPRITSELVIATVVELAGRSMRSGEVQKLANRLPRFAVVLLTPFLGAVSATKFVADKTAATA